MLSKLFTSKVRVGILSLLLFNQDKDYHLREIARLINSLPGPVSRELDNLRLFNLIKVKTKGQLSIYSINQDCIFLEDLKNIFIKTDYLGTLIKTELINKVKYCLIYGSFAKGTENSNSDIDLLVISEIKEDVLLKIIKKIEDITKREINFILWNENTFKTKAKSNHLLKTINQNNIIMLVGEEDEFRKQIK
jgi:predicted nucleotidyltransferase